MGIESNKEAYAMMQNTLGSIENRFREAYNKGYHDGLKEGINQATRKIASKILDEVETDMTDGIYPLVVVEDRYGGTYSGGAFTAWNLYLGQIPRDIDGDDVTCINFWGSWGESYKGIVGLGKTPGEAIADLRLKMNEQAERNE